MSASVADFFIDYESLVADCVGSSIADKKIFLRSHVPEQWHEQYLKMTDRQTYVLYFDYNGFEYAFDYFSDLERKGILPVSDIIEDRVVGVIGTSKPTGDRKTGSWMKTWSGPTRKRFGPQFHKGHFIAHSIGGGLQINIFAQRLDINLGKRFRDMEKYCFRYPDTLCFHRPIYTDASARPAALEFGLLTRGGRLWVERFDNREIPVDGRLFQNQVRMSRKDLNPGRAALRKEQ